MNTLWRMMNVYIKSFSWPDIQAISVMDIVQIIIIAVFVYHLLLWIKNTRAYTLLKGILLVGLFLLVAEICQMHTILWIWEKISYVAITGVLIIFQPELRKALEQLGEKKILSSIIAFDSAKEDNNRFSDNTINELVRASYDMGEVKTGALIVIEQNINLDEYIKTGIRLSFLGDRYLKIFCLPLFNLNFNILRNRCDILRFDSRNGYAHRNHDRVCLQIHIFNLRQIRNCLNIRKTVQYGLSARHNHSNRLRFILQPRNLSECILNVSPVLNGNRHILERPCHNRISASGNQHPDSNGDQHRDKL